MKGLLVVGAMWLCCLCVGAQTLSTAQLKAKADEVLRESTNGQRRRQVVAVFEYAERLLEEGRHAEGIKYLTEGLRVYPWSLKHQMIYAKILQEQGELQAAQEKAELVRDHAEEGKLIREAQQMLGEKPVPQNFISFPTLKKVPGDEPCVVLIPFQNCEPWLLIRVKEQLSGFLDVPVYIQRADIRYPEPARDLRGATLNRMRRQIVRGLESDQQLRMAMNRLKYSAEDLRDEKKLIHLIALLSRKTESELRIELNELKGQDPQWDATQLQAALRDAVRPCRRAGVGYLGVTSEHMYSNDYNFLFGWSNPGGGIISYHRFRADFSGEVPNQERLVKRTAVQSLASAGLVFRIRKCTNPTCALAYPNSLQEHDTKEVRLCSGCRKAFDVALKKQ